MNNSVEGRIERHEHKVVEFTVNSEESIFGRPKYSDDDNSIKEIEWLLIKTKMRKSIVKNVFMTKFYIHLANINQFKASVFLDFLEKSQFYILFVFDSVSHIQ